MFTINSCIGGCISTKNPFKDRSDRSHSMEAACCTAHQLSVDTCRGPTTVRPWTFIHRHATTRPLGQEVNATLCIFTHLQANRAVTRASCQPTQIVCHFQCTEYLYVKQNCCLKIERVIALDLK